MLWYINLKSTNCLYFGGELELLRNICGNIGRIIGRIGRSLLGPLLSRTMKNHPEYYGSKPLPWLSPTPTASAHLSACFQEVEKSNMLVAIGWCILKGWIRMDLRGDELWKWFWRGQEAYLHEFASFICGDYSLPRWRLISLCANYVLKGMHMGGYRF